MTEDIKVNVVEFGDRRFYQLQWKDPITGAKQTRSSKIEQTGRKRERQAAERAAAKLEAELREGRFQETARMTWEAFRERHEQEAQAGLAESTCKWFHTVFQSVEDILRPKLLREISTEAVSRWVAKLMDSDRSPATVGIYCRHLRAALNWAAEMQFLRQAPRVRPPKSAKAVKMKGRAIVGEEHDRMKAAVERVVKGPHAAAWRFFLEGLWTSGLRIGEAVGLSWDTREPVSVVMQPGYHPVLKFQPQGQKSKRAELVPCAPEFARLLEAVPEDQRTGPVFKLTSWRLANRLVGLDRARAVVAEVGKTAGVVVDDESGRTATAHDYRRAFGTRWSRRVMPVVLQRMMRHKDIKTTLGFYIDQDVEDLGGVVWEAFERATGESNTLGNSRQKSPVFSGENA